jgi:glycosyltransferase involved in cell wall biosynthesis
VRCLQVNKFWYPRAGADIYALQVTAQLERRGHTVRVLAVAHPENLAHPDARFWPRYFELGDGGDRLSWRGKAMAATRMLYNRSAARAVRQLIGDGEVHVAHVHNFVRHLSPAPLRVLRQHGIPLVATLHDYWPVCPTYSLVQGDGSRCEWECTRLGPSACLRHLCVAQHRGASALAAAEFALHRTLRWGADLFDVLLSPSRFLADMVQRESSGSLPIEVVTHPWPKFAWYPPEGGGSLRVLYVGRLAKEKGVDVLIAAARGAPWSLTIVGGGPHEGALRQQAGAMRNVRFAGFLNQEGVTHAMRSAHVVTIPSIWFENAPLTLLEAFATGRVVVASRIGGIPEYAAPIPGALLLEAEDIVAWRETLTALAQTTARTVEMGRAAWEAAQQQPGWSEHIAALEQIYTRVGSR